MRGGVTISELYSCAVSDLKYYTDVIEENIELSKKTKQLVY